MDEGGRISFSQYFWENLFLYDIEYIFEDAKSKEKIKNQYPQILPNPNEVIRIKCEDNDKKFLVNCLGIAGPSELPDIKSVTIFDEFLTSLDPNDNKFEPFTYNRLTFSVSADPNNSITNVWASIYYTEPSGELEIFKTDPNQCDCTEANVCSISPDYSFCYPGAYELWFYARRKNNEISMPYPLYFTIPMAFDNKEPNDTPEQAQIINLDIPQDHYLIDSNDVDWVKIPIVYKGSYEIKIIPKYDFLADSFIS